MMINLPKHIQFATDREMYEHDEKLCSAYLWIWENPFAKAAHTRLRAHFNQKQKNLAAVIKIGRKK